MKNLVGYILCFMECMQTTQFQAINNSLLGSHNEVVNLKAITCYRGRCVRSGAGRASWRWHWSLWSSRLTGCMLRTRRWRRCWGWCWSGDSTRTVCIWIQVIWWDAATTSRFLETTEMDQTLSSRVHLEQFQFHLLSFYNSPAPTLTKELCIGTMLFTAITMA